MGRLDILKQENRQNITESSYKSEFNFLEYEIEDENIINQITEKEEEITIIAKQIARKTLELGKMLYETQQILSNFKNGTFVAWFNYMGIDKNTVYREINRWELFQKFKNPQVAEASVRTLEFIKKHEEKLEEITITEILKEPKEAPQKIKFIVDENKVITNEEFDKEYEIIKINEKIKKLNEQIQKLEIKKQNLME